MTLLHVVGLTECRANSTYLAMTFPHFRPRLRRIESDQKLRAFALHGDNRVMGLAVAEADTVFQSAEILSIFLRKECRGNGHGKHLLETVEQRLVDLNITSLEGKFTRLGGEPHAIEKLLASCRWSAPKLRMRLFDLSTAAILQSKWVSNFTVLPESYEISPWSTVRPSEILELRGQSWIPKDLHPEEHIYAGNDGAETLLPLCFVCRFNGDIIGWHFTHKIDETQVRFSVSYIHPEFQRDMLLIGLWYHAAVTTDRHGFERIRMGVNTTHAKMLEFCEQFMMPHATRVDDSMGVTKIIGKGAEDLWV